MSETGWCFEIVRSLGNKYNDCKTIKDVNEDKETIVIASRRETRCIDLKKGVGKISDSPRPLLFNRIINRIINDMKNKKYIKWDVIIICCVDNAVLNADSENYLMTYNKKMQYEHFTKTKRKDLRTGKSFTRWCQLLTKESKSLLKIIWQTVEVAR